MTRTLLALFAALAIGVTVPGCPPEDEPVDPPDPEVPEQPEQPPEDPVTPPQPPNDAPPPPDDPIVPPQPPEDPPAPPQNGEQGAGWPPADQPAPGDTNGLDATLPGQNADTAWPQPAPGDDDAALPDLPEPPPMPDFNDAADDEPLEQDED